MLREGLRFLDPTGQRAMLRDHERGRERGQEHRCRQPRPGADRERPSGHPRGGRHAPPGGGRAAGDPAPPPGPVGHARLQRRARRVPGAASRTSRIWLCCPAARSRRTPPICSAWGAWATCCRCMRASAEVVIVDSPPLLPVADTRVLLRLSEVDGVIMVGRGGFSRRDRCQGGQPRAGQRAAGGSSEWC